MLAISIFVEEPLQDTEDVWEVHIMGRTTKSITTGQQEGHTGNDPGDVDIPLVRAGEPFLLVRFTIHKAQVGQPDGYTISGSVAHVAEALLAKPKFVAVHQAVAAVSKQRCESLTAAKNQCILCSGSVVLAVTP